ncbi:MAG TPA: hypothetical protein DCQ26_00960 [Marinilabiliales bacterium]|nr:MAG: hypothetical protein A2W88_19065 [Bacteroidetes bacterium GWF2_40_13]HAM97157.1 hypothetical protein [Marinilabiliales bacterium]HBX84376.1 hypothetical protein [Marinilabiliales bacterium]HBY53414.1 hypothetical protein [Marinilabiliales bacterium]
MPMSRNVRNALYGLFLVLLIILLVVLGRNWVLQATIKKAQQKFQGMNQMELSINGTRFVGLAQIHINQILLSNPQTDTLVQIDSLLLQLKIWELFKGTIRLKDLEAKHLTLNYRELATTAEGPSNNRLAAKVSQEESLNYSRILNRVLKTSFSMIPNRMQLANIRVNYITPEHRMVMECPQWELKNHQMEGRFSISKNGVTLPEFALSGTLDGSRKFMELRCSKTRDASVTVPIFEPRLGLGMQFDTLHFKVQVVSSTPNKVFFSGLFGISDLRLNHPKLAQEPVSFHEGSFQFQVTIENNSVEFDSASVVTFNKLVFSPYLHYQNQPRPRLEVKILPFGIQAGDLLSSLPDGLFTSFRGMEINGALKYNAQINIPLDDPDSLRAVSEVTNRGIAIQRFGTASLTQLNDTFTYQVYKDGRNTRSIFVGPGNPCFVGLDQVSPYLKNAVITSEDGGFFYHKGFDQEAIKHAIADNLKKGRFARGGSTITMQLVKNVFLTQQKTISRKMEEWMMVWLIENLNLTTKERMFEVYLNVIEWGPNIYGICEASEFYFDKSPMELTLNESIFLASIIPSPTRYKYTFDKEGNIRDFYFAFHRFLIETMLKREQITSEDTLNLLPDFELKGLAREFVSQTDSSPTDSTLREEPLELD